jgi:hypothetical protein
MIHQRWVKQDYGFGLRDIRPKVYQATYALRTTILLVSRTISFKKIDRLYSVTSDSDDLLLRNGQERR